MKKTLQCILLFCCVAGFSFAQSDSISIDSALASYMRLDFAIPSMPAFKLLGTEPSTLLRPADAKEISTHISEFYSGNKIVIPKDFGIELSPALILKNSLRKGPNWGKGWESLQLSFGATRPDLAREGDGYANLSLGLRYTVFAKGNVNNLQDSLRRELQVLTRHKNIHAGPYERKFLAEKGLNIMDVAGNDSLVTAMNNYVNQHYNNDFPRLDTLDSRLLKVSATTYQAKIAQIKDKWKRQNWANVRWDMAAAVSWASPDTIANLAVDSLSISDSLFRFQRFGFWTSVSIPFPSGSRAVNRTQWGQLLFGLNAMGMRSFNSDSSGVMSKTDFSAAFSSRFYFGSNRIKGFAEGQIKLDGLDSDWKGMASLGIEVSVLSGIWINVYAGVEGNINDNSARPIANLDFRFTLPENFKMN